MLYTIYVITVTWYLIKINLLGHIYLKYCLNLNFVKQSLINSYRGYTFSKVFHTPDFKRYK